jgi:hypothetical protein
MDMKGLNAFRDGAGQINLSDVVVDSMTPDGQTLRQGLFFTEESAGKFMERARARGQKVTEREIPASIVIDAISVVTMPFAFSIEARKVAAKIAMSAIAYEYGVTFADTSQFDKLRQVCATKDPQDLPVRIFANDAFMAIHSRTAHQHSVMCYMSAGMHKGWALVSLFGGISYLVEVTTDYKEPQSRQFSIFYNAATKIRTNPIVLANEMTVIGHVLSPATKFEDRDATDKQWFPIIAAFCAERGFGVERFRGTNRESPQK